MRTEFPEEATTLLEEQQPQQQRNSREGRGRTLRLALGALALAGVLVAAVAAVDAAAMTRQAEMNAAAATHADDVGYGVTTDLSAQAGMFGWDSISNTWCSFRTSVVAGTYCPFVSDKEGCKQETKAACEPEAGSGGAGSGSGSGSWSNY